MGRFRCLMAQLCCCARRPGPEDGFELLCEKGFDAPAESVKMVTGEPAFAASAPLCSTPVAVPSPQQSPGWDGPLVSIHVGGQDRVTVTQCGRAKGTGKEQGANDKLPGRPVCVISTPVAEQGQGVQPVERDPVFDAQSSMGALAWAPFTPPPVERMRCSACK